MFNLLGILLLSSLEFMGSCKQQLEAEIYLVPKGYQGAVYIIFNQKSGVSPKYENKMRLYEIPLNGILQTQFKPNEEWHNLPLCFYVDDYGKRFEIPYKLLGSDVKGDTIQTCCASSGIAYKDDKDKATSYDIFFIGTEKVIDSAFENRTKFNLSKYLED